MEHDDWLVRQFEQQRARLAGVALRMLGSTSDADDAVQEAWLRLSRSDTAAIDNLAGWLTTVVARICLDMLRSRSTRRELALEDDRPELLSDDGSGDPQVDVLLADSLGPALFVVLDTLSPPERVALVLHDMFGLPFRQIAPIVGRSESATRQLASRARRRVRGAGIDRHKRAERHVVDAFLRAAREGDLATLVAVLHPECRLRSDQFAALLGAPQEIEGGTNVADFFNGGADDAQRATIDGMAAAAWAPGGRTRVAFVFTFKEQRIVDIELVADRKRLQQLEIVFLDR